MRYFGASSPLTAPVRRARTRKKAVATTNRAMSEYIQKTDA
jgi:hypothetical protein